MIVSNSRRYVFVHVHKTAGTAVTKQLEDAVDWNDLIISGARSGNAVESWYKERFDLEMHARAVDIRRALGPDTWANYYTFSFVRDPYSRAVSLYTWLDGLYRKRGLRRIERHFRHVLPVKGRWSWPGMTAYLETRDFSGFLRHRLLEAGMPGAMPMVDSLCDDGDIIVDFVGKTETLDADFATVAKRIGLESDGIPRRNASSSAGGPERHYATQADLDLVYERYRDDFECFGYRRRSLDTLSNTG